MNSNEEILIIIGNNIRKLRNQKKISQQELADITNIAKSTVQRIESGKLNPTILMLNSISTSLNISITEILIENKNK